MKSVFTVKGFLILTVSLIALLLILLLNVQHIKPSGLLTPTIPSDYRLTNVHIVDVEQQTIIENQQLVISQGKITHLLPSHDPSFQNLPHIDGNGQYVTPGLFDMHVHALDRSALSLNLAYGVTSVRMMRGHIMHQQWQKELRELQWLGSHLFVSSPVFANANTHEFNLAIQSPEHARKAVQKVKADGFDMIKLYGYLPSDSFEAVIKEANKLGVAIAKHGPQPAKDSSWDYLTNLQSLEHAEEIFQHQLNYRFDRKKLTTIADQIAATHTPVTPTLSNFEHLMRLSRDKNEFIETLELDYLNPFLKTIEEEYSVSRWLADDKKQSQYHEKKLKMLIDISAALHQAGVPLLTGSDAGTMYMLYGESLHREIALLQQAGLTSFEALQAATINPAKALKVDDQLGSISANKTADMLLTQTNPITDLTVLSQPNVVIKNGQWLDKATLQQLKESAKQHPNYWLTALLMLKEQIDRRLFW